MKYRHFKLPLHYYFTLPVDYTGVSQRRGGLLFFFYSNVSMSEADAGRDRSSSKVKTVNEEEEEDQ